MVITILALLLSLIAIFGSTAFHYEALRQIDRLVSRPRHPRLVVPTALTLVISIHVLEILIYMAIYAIAQPLGIGRFSGDSPGVLSLFYYAASIYSSLGADDVVPHGALRLIVSAGSLNGILLLAWSGAFLFALTDRLKRID